MYSTHTCIANLSFQAQESQQSSCLEVIPFKQHKSPVIQWVDNFPQVNSCTFLICHVTYQESSGEIWVPTFVIWRKITLMSVVNWKRLLICWQADSICCMGCLAVVYFYQDWSKPAEWDCSLNVCLEHVELIFVWGNITFWLICK